MPTKLTIDKNEIIAILFFVFNRIPFFSSNFVKSNPRYTYYIAFTLLDFC